MTTIEINDIKISPDSKTCLEFISSVNSDEISYNDFFSKYLIDNEPCIIQSSSIKNWPCRKSWIQNGAPNFELLEELFGNCKVPVADCKKRYYNSQYKNEMTIKSYMDYWKNYRVKNYPHDSPLLYLKDWHCKKDHPEISIYEVPKYFASDWLNEYYMDQITPNDDYMFVYMGPKGSWTPFHSDVFSSYSWSANVHGKKRWLLFPPGNEKYLRDSYGKLIYDLTDNEKVKQNDESITFYDITQETGEIIFVPSGWHHQVWNLEDTISINHNWINGCNIHNVWLALQNELLSVMREIEDCQDMEDWSSHCQLMLKTSYGMNYVQFYDFLSFIAKKRINSLIHKIPSVSFNKWILGKNHNVFDLLKIEIVLQNFVQDTKEKCIFSLIWSDCEIETLLEEISSILQAYKQ